MRCREVEELASEFIDGELGALQTAAVEKHLADCPSCSEMVAELRALTRMCSTLPQAPVPSGLRDSILQRLQSRTPPVSPGRLARYGAWAAAAVIVLGLGAARFAGSPPAPTPIAMNEPEQAVNPGLPPETPETPSIPPATPPGTQPPGNSGAKETGSNEAETALNNAAPEASRQPNPPPVPTDPPTQEGPRQEAPRQETPEAVAANTGPGPGTDGGDGAAVIKGSSAMSVAEAAENGASASEPAAAGSNRLLSRTVEAVVKAEKSVQLLEITSSWVTSLGGRVETSGTVSRNGRESAKITAVLPRDRENEVIAKLSQLGAVSHKASDVKDYTETVRGIEERLHYLNSGIAILADGPRREQLAQEQAILERLKARLMDEVSHTKIAIVLTDG